MRWQMRAWPVSKYVAAAALAMAYTLASAPPSAAASCWVSGVDFEGYGDGHSYSADDASGDFATARGPYKMLEGGDVGQALTRIEDHAMRAEYPEGKILGTDTGFTFYSVADEPADEAWMTYKLYFSRDFDWTKGGKLPGLCGGPVTGSGRTCPVGCSTVDREDGFSARLMWREGGAIVAYLYYPDKPKSVRCGEDYVFDITLESGRWYTIAISVTLNSVSDAGPSEDGEVRAWIDGSEVLDLRNIVLRHDEDIKVTRTYLTTYVGGSTQEFAPSHDQYALFDDIASGPGTDVGVCDVGDDEVRDQSGPPTNQGAGPQSTVPPARVFDFEMVDAGVGWGVPDSFANVATPSDARANANATGGVRSDTGVYDAVRFCYTRCSYEKKCVAFTVYAGKCWMHTGVQTEADKRNYSDMRIMYTKAVDDPNRVQDQSGPACGDLDGSCCYAAGRTDPSSLCGAGDCKPSASAAEIRARGSDALPCLCSSSVCVANLEYCPQGAVCDQSGDVPPCGALNEDCCAGNSCNEEEDIGGTITGLACSAGKCIPY